MLIKTITWVLTILGIWTFHRSMVAPNEKGLSFFGVITRCIVGILLIGKLVGAFLIFPHFALFNYLQAIVLAIIWVIVELSIRRRRLTFGSPRLARISIVAVALLMLLIPW